MRAIIVAIALAGALGLSTSVRADVQVASVAFQNSTEQTGPSTVNNTGGIFTASGIETAPGLYSSATVTVPTGQVSTLNPLGTVFFFYDQPANLTMTYPTGSYVFNFDVAGSASVVTRTVHVNSFLFPLSAPVLTPDSYNALQGMDVSQGLTISFNSFVSNPAAFTGNIQLTFIPTNGVDPQVHFTQPNLNATSIFVPANSLLPNEDYAFQLLFGESAFGFDQGTFTSVGFDNTVGGAFHTSGVPEPDAWLLMISGFIAVGGLLRRSRTSAMIYC